MTRSFSTRVSWHAFVLTAFLALAVSGACGGTNPAGPTGGTNTTATGNPCWIITGETTTSFPAAGGSAQISVSAASTCSWTATSSTSYLTITSGHSGVGDGVVKFTMAPNPGNARFAILTITGTDITITQAGAAGRP